MNFNLLAIKWFIYYVKLEVASLYLAAPSPTVVEETQHAVCKIITEEVEATANASITRQLKGVCSSDHMNERFDRIEKIVLKQIDNIINLLENNRLSTTESPKRQFLKFDSNIDDDFQFASVIKNDRFKPLNYFSTTYKPPTERIQIIGRRDTKNKNLERTTNVNVRDLEILKFNSTIQKSNYGKTYLYYWRVYDINEILHKSDTFIRSPEFFAAGFRLQITLISHHLGTKYVGIQLEANKHFLLAHRFTILNKFDPKADFTSQLLGDSKNFAMMYRISHDKIENENFIYNDNLIIKLTVYLNNNY